MTAEEAFVKCPKCLRQNVEPRGEGWHCTDCNEDFEAVGVQLPPPPKSTPPRPKRPPK